MKRRILFLISIAWVGTASAFSLFSESEITRHWARSPGHFDIAVDHTLWGELLEKYIRDEDGLNVFAYAKVNAEDKDKLVRYLGALQRVNAGELEPREQMAFWINLYNALTVQVILDHYPVASILDISPGLFSRGPWKEKRVHVEDIALSLDDIEHEILRPIFKDNRIHYAVNCASIGCPNLQTRPFTRRNLEKMLDDSARQYINHPRGVSIIEGRLIVSGIYDWYADDFGDSEKEVIDHLTVYARSELAQRLRAFTRISDYQYNWSLNE